jgi:hypothetical protein
VAKLAASFPLACIVTEASRQFGHGGGHAALSSSARVAAEKKRQEWLTGRQRKTERSPHRREKLARGNGFGDRRLSELGTVAARHRVECGVCWGRLPIVWINRRLLLGSTLGFFWDRPSALAGIDRKLQDELC